MHPDSGLVRVEFDQAEAGVLGSLAAQTAVLIRTGGDDPALARLLPDAYPDDAEAGAEFRRWTGDDLVGRKSGNVELVATTLATTSVDSPPAEVTLDAEAADRWLRALTDIRLTLADRLGIETDDHLAPDDELGSVYRWLGELQWALVDTMDRIDADGSGDAAAAD